MRWSARAAAVYVMDNPPQSIGLGQLARMSLSSRGGPIVGTASLSSMPYNPVFNAQGAEVEVDRETGQVRVTRFVQAQDVGLAVNPMGVVGQLEGGAVQGIGRALSEEILIDRNTGQVRNASLATYLMPLAIDMPEIETVLVGSPQRGRSLRPSRCGRAAGIRPAGSHRQRHLRRCRRPHTHPAAQRGASSGCHAGPRTGRLRPGPGGPAKGRGLGRRGAGLPDIHC